MINRENLIRSEPFPTQFNDDMASVYDYWRSKCPEDAPSSFPQLNDIDLMDLYKVSSNLMLCDVIRDEEQTLRYRWRYWGSSLSTFYGIELSGKFIHESYSEEAARKITGCYDWVVETKEPHYWMRYGGLAADDQDHLAYERIICPVAGKSGNVDHLFGIITFVKNAFQRNKAEETEDGRKVATSPIG